MTKVKVKLKRSTKQNTQAVPQRTEHKVSTMGDKHTGWVTQNATKQNTTIQILRRSTYLHINSNFKERKQII